MFCLEIRPNVAPDFLFSHWLFVRSPIFVQLATWNTAALHYPNPECDVGVKWPPQLQLAAVSSHVCSCVEYEFNRWPIPTYCTFKSK